MVVRESFQHELDELKSMLNNMGQMAESALESAIESLKNQDVDQALQIIENDYRINDLEEEINDKAILLIAKQSPVATDLRRIIAAIKISSDVERIADFAVNIAKSVIRIGSEQFVKPIEEIPQLAEKAKGMLTDSIKAYDQEDVVLAKNVAEIDDSIDEAYGRLIQELLHLMTQKQESIAQITQLAFICRYIERTADHATNISESVIYLVKGRRYDLND